MVIRPILQKLFPIMLIFLLLTLSGCSEVIGGAQSNNPASTDVSASDSPSTEPPGASEPSLPPEPAPPRLETVTLVAAGDILMHNTQIWSGQQPDGSYFFDFFAPVKNYIQEGDYASTNFEAALAGPASEYTGYPLFNSPDAIADTIKDAGFDLVVAANNHILDRGYKGAVRTLEVLQQAGLDTIGAYKSQAEADQFLIKTINDVKVGYLAYTYSTNGIPIPQDHPYLVSMLDREKILADIEALRPQVDILVLIAHWGIEYQHQPSAEQKQLAEEFLSAGVDIILGSHPHVIQPLELLTIDGKVKPVFYSMGNFVSHQRGLERNSGVIVKVKFVKNMDSGECVLDEVAYTPTFSHTYQENGKLMFRVVAIEEAIAQIKAGQEPYLRESDLPTLEQALAKTRSLLGEEYQAESPDA